MSKAFDSIKNDEETYLLKTYARYPLAIDHGKGSRLWDCDGKEYIDLLAGIAVCGLGHCNDEVIGALTEQAHKLWHVSNLFYQEPQIQLAKLLVSTAHFAKAFFCNSGAEANEAAIKLARRYTRKIAGRDAPDIITLTSCFHGRTLGTLAATGRADLMDGFTPVAGGFKQVPANDLSALEAAIDDKTCAVMMECIQGEAGVMPLGADYVKAARKLCDEHKALLIIDEVQTGIGRTGAWFAFQREDLSGGVTPDIVTFAKGVGGGFPMGGMISFGAELSALFTPGSHGSTFAGNPLGASAALATLGVIEEDNLVDNAEERGKQLRDGIASCGNPLFVSVRGRGLLDAIELAHPCSHAAMNWALEHGLIVNAVAPNALRLAPPLVITAQDVDQAVSILAKIPSDLPND